MHAIAPYNTYLPTFTHIQVVFDRRKNESITTDFALIVSRSGQLSLVREGKQSWLGAGAAAKLGKNKEEGEGGGVRERIYAQAEEGGSVVLAPEHPGDIVVLSMQEAIRMPIAPPSLASSSPFASYLPALRASKGSSSSSSVSYGGYNVMPGTHVLAREGSITSHTIRDAHLTKTMGLVGLRRYRGTGTFSVYTFLSSFLLFLFLFFLHFTPPPPPPPQP